MVYNLWCFIRFARRIRQLENWGRRVRILYLPIAFLALFLAGYLAVGLTGEPDLVIASILLGGSIFVQVMYILLSSITNHILENEQREARLFATEETSRAKAAFLASVSHEMRTPMNVILGLAAVALREPALPEKTRAQLVKLDRSGQHLLSLINHLLELNSLDAAPEDTEDALRPHPAPFAPGEALDELDAIVGTLCEEKGLRYRFEKDSALPERCEGDARQLKEVLLSLLDNAVKYTDAPGEVVFAAECESVDEAEARLRFTVRDTGVGMSADFLTHLFNPFAREDESAVTRFDGSGLSLAVAKRLMERMGGAIRVESEKGKGSSFTVTLSLPVVAPEEPQPEPEPVSLAGRRVLVVEDVPENAEVVMDLLELEDVETEHAENGQIAVSMFEEHPAGYYDAVLMDLRMPVMDGLEATRRIRALPREDARAVPILALTANAFPSDMQATHEAGMNAHLAKPSDAEILYGALREWIGKTADNESHM
ncbi:MAG: ATP-binding protein [bacterium]